MADTPGNNKMILQMCGYLKKTFRIVTKAGPTHFIFHTEFRVLQIFSRKHYKWH